MEAGEYGLTTDGTRFVAGCLEVVEVAALMWLSWCVFGGEGLFSSFLFFHQTNTTCCKYEITFASFTSLLVVSPV